MSTLRKDRPGYQSRKRTNGTLAHYWNPGRAVKNAPKHLRLRPIADGATDATIVALCRQWTDELIADMAAQPAPRYDGTISSLIHLYRTDDESPYKALKASTRKNDYDPALKLIDKHVGERLVDELRGDDFRRWHRKWADGRKHLRRAHNAIRKLRVVLSYGVQQRLDGCSTVREILSLIEFEGPAPRTIKMEFAHAKAIVEQAMQDGLFSIALTQALQWDTALRRIDIIGEWLPAGDAVGGIISGKTRWQGPSVSVISQERILRIAATSKTGAESAHDLNICELTTMVLNRMTLPAVGPLIVSEQTGRPYRNDYYIREWRTVARKAKVPDEVWSMDSRAGAISEADAATNDIESARKLATHTTTKTTRRYVRNDVLESNRKTAEARAQHRQ